MTQCILILIIAMVGIFAVKSKYRADHSFMISNNNFKKSINSGILYTHTLIIYSGIMEENDILNDLRGNNKYLHSCIYSLNEKVKSEFISESLNHLPLIRKEVYFQGF